MITNNLDFNLLNYERIQKTCKVNQAQLLALPRHILIACYALCNIWVGARRLSLIPQSVSWPDESKPKYLNIVLEVISDLKPLELLKVSKDIEISLGRKKRYKNAPRECDIDIIDYKRRKRFSFRQMLSIWIRFY